MSDGYKFSNITDNQLRQLGVQALADRPNAAQRYGESGLSAQQLKLWFDNLATLLAGRLNELQTALMSEDATKYIGLAIGEYKSLGDLLNGIQNGSFAATVLKVLPNENADSETLQSVIFAISKACSDLKDKLDNMPDDFIRRLKDTETDIVYAESVLTGEVVGVALTEDATAGSVPKRDDTGNLNVAIFPEYDSSATSKKYVNDLLSRSLQAYIDEVDALLGGDS
jgi:hypothetical protein